jgi:hypothetical protein
MGGLRQALVVVVLLFFLKKITKLLSLKEKVILLAKQALRLFLLVVPVRGLLVVPVRGLLSCPPFPSLASLKGEATTLLKELTLLTLPL